jgi:hypothetical protein
VPDGARRICLPNFGWTYQAFFLAGYQGLLIFASKPPVSPRGEPEGLLCLGVACCCRRPLFSSDQTSDQQDSTFVSRFRKVLLGQRFGESGWRDLNPRPLAPQTRGFSRENSQLRTSGTVTLFTVYTLPSLSSTNRTDSRLFPAQACTNLGSSYIVDLSVGLATRPLLDGTLRPVMRGDD